MQQAGPVPLLERVQALTSLEYRPVDRGEEIYLVIGVSMQEVKNPADKLFNQVVGAFLGTLDGLTGGVSTFIVNWAGKRLIGEEFAEMMAVFQATDGWQIGSKFGTGAAIALSFTPCGMGWLTVARRVLGAIQAVGAIADAATALANGEYLAAAGHAASAGLGILGFLKACFAGDMLVLTRERGAVRWDELREGEEVWSQGEFDPNAAGAWKRVEEIFRTEAFIWKLRVAGQEIKTTDEHPFWVVGKGWVPAKELRPGDRLRSHDGERYPVESIEPTNELATVYNARIADYHTYYVQAPGGGAWLWAHNACVSRIHDDPGLVRHAQAAGRTHQASIDRLTAQLGNGNFNPGIGTRGVFGNVLEARARDGARVYFRRLPNDDAEILAKSSKANQDVVISILRRLYGG